MKAAKIQWHPGFEAAMNLEFAKNRQCVISNADHCYKGTG